MNPDIPAITRALESAAITMLNYGMNDWPSDSPAAEAWGNLIKGLKKVGAIGYVKRASGWAILYEMLPDDKEYLGMAGDGKGDRFAVSRQFLKAHLF